ncbi:unnamed protein product [Phytophthora fragariaefolia]|uniref:Unnamed protein product n=1 Tax=Phytophthora fragariaefolia TaxID=1490495 RepID=A0A9W7CJ24_9STRA|nr:unnamed protein product [Phytophthora fragariaefolia]
MLRFLRRVHVLGGLELEGAFLTSKNPPRNTMGEEAKDELEYVGDKPTSLSGNVGVGDIAQGAAKEVNTGLENPENGMEDSEPNESATYTPTQPYETSPKPPGRNYVVTHAWKPLLKAREGRSDWTEFLLYDGGGNGTCLSGSRDPAQAWTHTRLPWMDDYNTKMSGYAPNGIATPLFDCSMLRGASSEIVRDDESYWIDLFFKKRYYKAKKRSTFNPTVRSSPDSLAHSWHSFVRALLNDPEAWFDKLDKLAAAFFNYDIDGPKIEIHQRSIAENRQKWINIT